MFIGSTAAALAAAQLAAAPSEKEAASPAPASSSPATKPRRLNVGLIGVGGRGMNHVQEVSKIDSANVVALCDVDALTLVTAARMIKDAKVFTDFRDMLKLPGLDAVLVCTADHTHAVITAAALRAGKHVYCEKPLCHTIQETRAIVELAKETKLVTQMGIQMHASENYRRVVELIKSDAIGPVHDVHIWHNRTRRPHSEEICPPPAELNYDLWLGPAAMRPFKRGFHPYSWRHWWAFGNAQLGDQSCHFLDLVFWCLDLKYPTRITTHGEQPPSEEMVNNYLTAEFEYPARGNQPPVTIHWYDNPKKPADHAKWNLDPKLADEGIMFVGEKGMLCTNYTDRALLPAEKFKNFTPPPQSIPKSPAHQRDWVEACLANDPARASAPFSYGALMTETSILGTLAYRARNGEPLEYDGEKMRFPNCPEAEKFLGYPYRAGWTL